MSGRMSFSHSWNSAKGRGKHHDEVENILLSLTSCTTRCTSCLQYDLDHFVISDTAKVAKKLLTTKFLGNFFATYMYF